MITVRLNAAYFPAVEMLSGVASPVIVLYGGLQAIEGHITAGTVVAFVAALSYLFDPIQQLSQLYTTYQSGMAALEKIFQLLDVRPDLEDRPDARRAAPHRRRGLLPGHLLRLRPPRASTTDAGAMAERSSSETAPRAPASVSNGAASGGSRWTMSASTFPPARPWRSWAPPGRASRRWPSSSPASMTRPRDACSSTGTICATSPAPRCVRRWGSSRRRPSCSPAHQ